MEADERPLEELRIRIALAKAFGMISEAVIRQLDSLPISTDALSPELRADIQELRELRDIISRLTTIHWMDYSGDRVASQAKGTGKMISTKEVDKSTHQLLLVSHITYYHHYCNVCWRDWITAFKSNGEDYTPPERCKFLDCRSFVWNDPVKAIPKRVEYLKKKEKERLKKIAQQEDTTIEG